MRTLTEADIAILKQPTRSVWVRAWITDSEGNRRPLHDLGGTNWIVGAQWGATVDEPVSIASLYLWRNRYYYSLAHGRELSALNRDSAGGYAPLLDYLAEMEIETATVPRGVPP